MWRRRQDTNLRVKSQWVSKAHEFDDSRLCLFFFSSGGINNNSSFFFFFFVQIGFWEESVKELVGY